MVVDALERCTVGVILGKNFQPSMSKKRRVRVLMVAPTPDEYGGIAAFTASIARQTLDCGEVDVRVVFRRPGRGSIREKFKRDIGAHDIPWRMMDGLDFQYFKDLMWADVVNCHFPLVYATFPARLLFKKLVVTVENKQAPGHKPWFKLGLKLAHARWYISSYVRKTWEGDDHWEHSIVVPAITKLPDGWCSPEKRSGFFFIARWVPLKGLEQLIEAYASADLDRSKHRLILAGDGILRNKVESMIAETGIAGSVDVPGFISYEEKTRMITTSRWNVAPAAFPEDLGLTPIEGRSCGVPSIVSNSGGLPEAAGEYSLRCEPGDVASLRTALEKAAAMSDEEYLRYSAECHATLSGYLPDNRFYSQSFNRIAGR